MIAFALIYVLISLLAAHWASKKGREFWTVFIISLVISPLFIIVSAWRSFQVKN